MNQHTPGPWHSVSKPEGPNGAGRLWHYAHREPSLSSSCLSVGPFRTQQEADFEADRQNSLLLVRAAAPDLLAACKAALAYLDTRGDGEVVCAHRAVLSAAIAKAEGGAQ